MNVSSAQDHRDRDRNELARRAFGGCRASFDVLMHAHRPRLFYALRRRLPAWDQAEDATQEALLRAWEKRESFDPERDVWPWLLTLGMRVAVDHARRGARRPSVPLSCEPADQDNDGLQCVIRAEERRDLWAIVDRVLDPRQRTALWLVYGESMTPTAAAQAMRMTSVHLRVMLHRAKAKLRPHLVYLNDQGTDARSTTDSDANRDTICVVGARS